VAESRITLPLTLQETVAAVHRPSEGIMSVVISVEDVCGDSSKRYIIIIIGTVVGGMLLLAAAVALAAYVMKKRHKCRRLFRRPESSVHEIL
jgi:hypothetical protein